jgi:hypothetical protein
MNNRRLRLGSATLVGCMMLAACSTGGQTLSPSASPSPSFQAPSPTPTAPGTTELPGSPEPEPSPKLTQGGTTERGSARLDQVIVDVEPEFDEIRVYATVQGVFEEGGLCVATFTGPGDSFTLTTEALINVDRTECAGLVGSLGNVASGTWQVVLSYESESHATTASPVEVDIP